MKLTILLFLLNIFLPNKHPGEDEVLKQNITNHFKEQYLLFPQEKLHLHTDKPIYSAGENIWFKAYLVNSVSHELMTLSRYIYVELINPANVVVKRVKIRNVEDAYYGYISIPENFPEGNYSIRAYTYFMQNLDEDYYYRSPLYVVNPSKTGIEIDYEYIRNDKLKTTIIFHGDKKSMLEKVDIRMNNQPLSSFRKENDSTLYFSVLKGVKNEDGPRNVLYVGSDNNRIYSSIPSPESEYEVNFYPEGGYLVEENNCRIAFKALRPDGNREHVTGIVYNRNGRRVASFETTHEGMGVFFLTPLKDEIYYAVCKTVNGVTKRFELPQALKDAYSIQVSHVNDLLRLSVLSSHNREDHRKLYLLMQSREYPFYVQEWDHSKPYVVFDRSSLPSGVVHVMLLDEDHNILSERLVFGTRNETLDVGVQTDKDRYRTRDSVGVNIQLSDTLVQTAYLSVSVTDDSDVELKAQTSILANLLLASELKGYIADPDYYFRENDAEAEKALDILLLTHGWRRYEVQKVIKGDYQKAELPLEVGQELSGTINSFFMRKPVKNSEVTIICPAFSFFHQTQTDSTGRFYLRHFEFPDSTDYVVQALNKKGAANVELKIDEVYYPKVGVAIPDAIDSSSFRAYEKKAEEIKGMRMIQLDEIEVKGTYIEKDKSPFSDRATISFSTKDIEELDATCLHELFRRIPGMVVFGDDVYIRSRNTVYADAKAAIYIDGVYYTDSDLHIVHISEVARVDVFKPSHAAVFGTEGKNGVVYVMTKKGNFTLPDKPHYNVQRLIPLGYQRPVEFYAPRYDTEEKRNNIQPDMRTTIHWEADLRTDKNGQASFGFYTSDSPSTYTITIEGVTIDGNIIRKTQKINVAHND